MKKLLLFLLLLLLLPSLCFGHGPPSGFLDVTAEGNLPVIPTDADGDEVAIETISDRTHDIDGLNGVVTASASYGRVDDDTVKTMRLDASTEAVVQVSYEHHEVHGGSSFSAHYGNDVTNIGEMTCIGFNITGTAKWPHLVIHGSASAVSVFSMYRTTSIDVDEGTDLTIFNRNDNSDNTSLMSTIETAPTANLLTSYNEVQAAGANITMTIEPYHEQIGSAGNIQSMSGGSSRGQAERVLKQSDQYAVCITATSDADTHHNIILDWYEHTDRN